MRIFVLLTALFFTFSFGALAQTESVKLTGQIVCSECWFEETDRSKSPYGNQADIECAARCSKNGIGQSLAVKNEKGEFTLYEPEKGAFKIPAKDFLELVPKYAEIEGTIREEKNKKFLKVNALKIVKASLVEPILAAQNVDATLTLNDLSGVSQDIKQYKGRLVVLNFWATYCIPCKEEMPDLAAIQNDYGAPGVQVIGATADPETDKAKVLKFIRAAKVNFPVWLGLSVAQMESFGVGRALPGTAIINREGQIVWRKMGKIDAKELRAQLDKLLEENTKQAAQKKKEKELSSLVPA
jgi:thiol-disulfide isomerase/thioredoxin